MKIPCLIVSLTSFPAALHLAGEAIRSILRGTVQPEKIVLYLTASQFPDRILPVEIEALKAECPYFEVRFWERNIRSYTKLIPALHDFPEDIIVTVDDDIRYPPRLIERLLETHRKYPEAIVGHRVRRIEGDGEGGLTPYSKWKRYKSYRYLSRSTRPAYRNLLTGVGGVLYPPRCLDEAMLDPDLFMDIAPTVDDVWFWAAAVSAGTGIAPVPFGCVKLDELHKPKELSLKGTNIYAGRDVNREAAERILEKYPVVQQRLSEELEVVWILSSKLFLPAIEWFFRPPSET